MAEFLDIHIHDKGQRHEEDRGIMTRIKIINVLLYLMILKIKQEHIHFETGDIQD